MSQTSDIAQSKRNLQRILNFPFVGGEPVPATADVKTTSVSHGSIKKRSELEQLERLIGA